MVRLVILVAAFSALAVAPALAESTQTASPGPSALQSQGAPSGSRLELCVKDSPTLDYRACVNASTRDRNSKIRQA